MAQPKKTETVLQGPPTRNNKARLFFLLCAIFTTLAIPTVVLVWQTYNQLKWESFHQYRGMAEELIHRISNAIVDSVDKAESRSIAQYAFLVVTGDPVTNFVQRSPLSAFPVVADLPGTLGYFQVGTEGEFSTPLLPDRDTAPASVGLSNR
jgi:hypothetical protein